MTTRRDFVRLSSAAMFVGGRMRRVPRAGPAMRDHYPRAGDPHLRELAMLALDAAKSAGATYADIRLTVTDKEGGSVFFGENFTAYRSLNWASVGVRALVNGGWGFASSTLWTAEEMTRLGREAATLSRAIGGKRRTEGDWVPQPALTGTWATPVEIDPFTVPLAEKADLIQALGRRFEGRFTGMPGFQRVTGAAGYQAIRKETTFASTEGSFLTQTHYQIHPLLGVLAVCMPQGYESLRFVRRLHPCARGWEVLADPSLFDEVLPLFDEIRQQGRPETLDPNRYDILCDGTVTAQLVAQTIGVATELDRALGYEANAGGTSYLAPPEDMLGQYALGPADLTITANRSMPGMLGTTQWDDEGIVPTDYPVIQGGKVVGYHTNRDLAPALAAWDAKQGRPLGSRGCAVASRGEHIPLIQPPNLVMAPAATDTSFDDLVANLDHGLVIWGGYPPLMREPGLDAYSVDMQSNRWPERSFQPGGVTVDRQQLNGEIRGAAYEVRKGKRVRAVENWQALFRAPELWKNVQAIGGQSTQMESTFSTWKGQPGQESFFSVRACAARFKQVACTDPRRRA